MNDKERAALEAWIAKLGTVKAGEGLILSLYVPPDQLERARRMVTSELALAGNVKNRVVRQGVEASLKDALRAMTYPLGADALLNGFAVFADGFGQPQLVVPPEPLTGFLYRCEKTCHLAPLEDMLVPRSVVGLIVLDRGEATFGWTDGRRIVLLRTLHSYITGKHGAGGMSVNRWARQIQQSVDAFFTKVGEEANATFLPMMDRIERIVVGGPALTKGEFVSGEFMDYRLRDKLDPKMYPTGYVDFQGIKELCVRAGLADASAKVTEE